MSSYRFLVRAFAGVLALAASVTAVAAQQRSDFGTLSIQVRPPDAEIYIDGNLWQGPQGSGPLLVQLLPGQHRVEMRAPGRQQFSTEVTIRAGETYPLNVSLTQGGGVEAGPPQPLPPAPRPPQPPRPPAPVPPSAPGLVQVEDSGDGFVFAPVYKIAEVDHHTGQFLGMYGGMVFAGQFMIGAGGYWQMDSTYGTHLTYGGPVLEWRVFRGNAVGFNLHGLIGGGWRYADYGYHGCYYCDGGHPDPHNGYYYNPYPYGWDNGFFVAEPEAQVVFRFGSSMRVQAGVGYRATSEHGANGVSGSFAVQIGR